MSHAFDEWFIDHFRLALGGNTRSFSTVFAMAQRGLQSTFGMELVELMNRAERDREENANDEIQNDANATGLKKKCIAMTYQCILDS